MLAAGVLLFSLSVWSVYGQDTNIEDSYIDYGDFDSTNAHSTTINFGDWLFDLMDEYACDPNPCQNGGSCQSKSATEFTCLCPEPYAGQRCQRVRNICENVDCGWGDCLINLGRPLFYECKCRPPFQGPNCKSLSTAACQPNPCQNGGTCIRGNRRFRCACPDGYIGKLCEAAPNDCYEGNGETYRGVFSMSEDGLECLDWRSFYIVANGADPFTLYPDFTGLENNYCRNPDGDDKPWCYIKRQNKLEWEFCKVRQCSEAQTTAPPVVPPVQAQFSQCGIPQPTRIGRIFGGTKSVPGAHPWQVSVQSRSSGSLFQFSHICGGILIKSCWVLTAGHCIGPGNEYQVVLGGVNIDKQEEMDQTIPVIQTIVHENYRETPYAVYNDIALLKLNVMDNPYCAKETRSVKTACLPDQAFPARKECVISGWGTTETQRYSSHLMNARVFLISDERCKTPEVYGNVLDDSMFCAGTLQGSIDSCQGDSGGPLVCEQGGTYYITGVVSWGDGCGQKNKPGVYANVLSFNSWIKSRIN
ncbi:hyaluronan-binding protein 2 [Brachionichthys hirsutus]|uniref:hyaluronan-binding protein 2 n=1 Tax=Brachionichthys hirsutus TaxID=412623 RepID=UPI003604DAC5